MAPLVRTAGVAALAVLLLVPAGPAAAHAVLADTTPADGSRVETRLRRVTLRFTGQLDADGAAVAVTDPDGTRVDVGEPTVRTGRLRQPVRPLRRGRHTVRFRVFALDGHPVDGHLSFRYAGPVPAGATGGAPKQADAGHPTEQADAGDATEQARPTDAAGRPDATGNTPALAVNLRALAVAGVLLAGVVVVWRRRRP